MNTMTLVEFMQTVLPLLMAHVMDRVDREVVEGKVTAYWVGNVLRIDLKTEA